MKGILFNTFEVQAILDDRKFATRRPLKLPKHIVKQDDGLYTLFAEGGSYENCHLEEITFYIKSKYQAGDILYVRETFCYDDFDNGGETIYYKADYGERHLKDLFTDCGMKWRPSIHMPREAARIFLKVTDVKVERLQDISSEGCVREGIRIDGGTSSLEMHYKLKGLFISTFLEIYPDCTEESYVWVYEFKRIDKPEDKDA